MQTTQRCASSQRPRSSAKPASSVPLLTPRWGPGRRGSTLTCQTSCIHRFGRLAWERWTNTLSHGSWILGKPRIRQTSAQGAGRSRVRGAARHGQLRRRIILEVSNKRLLVNLKRRRRTRAQGFSRMRARPDALIVHSQAECGADPLAPVAAAAAGPPCSGRFARARCGRTARARCGRSRTVRPASYG